MLTVNEETEAPEIPWSRFYAECRSEMEFRYGHRRIPKDKYKEQYALGANVQQAAKNIYNHLAATGQAWKR